MAALGDVSCQEIFSAHKQVNISDCLIKKIHNSQVSLIMGASYEHAISGVTRMSQTRSEQMVNRLRSMQAAAPDIEASAIVSVDGLIMASALPADVEEDRVSAMSAAMLSLGERIANELGRGGLEQVYIKGNTGFIVLTSVGAEAVLTSLARQDAKLGLIFLEMRRAAEDLVKLVG
jgi:predicted regulator of Ras-like GTPase activity (Roadblock/LC7/MglB family)